MRLGLASVWHLTRCPHHLPAGQVCLFQALGGVLQGVSHVLVDGKHEAGGRGFGGVLQDGGACAMKHTERKMLGYSKQQVFEVVSQVQNYSEFVPWCVRSTVLKQEERYMEAELEVGFQLFVERYLSRIRLDPPHSIYTSTDESTLFSYLNGIWKLEEGPTPSTCLTHFRVEFAFKSPLYQQVAMVFFEEVVKKMLGAFEQRLQIVYGPSSMIRTSKAAKAVT